ncbi:MAG: DsrE family protein [Desulfuromonadaceae bacterium]|nr:DsrE family protein [Desulfuromonadaceae bacterium]MDD2847979.1 DsrE family protein [Desulfuromonadaceae bacterium]MDD4131279.1 DsrE family protein [Desulfuromonadaceae bacterium]
MVTRTVIMLIAFVTLFSLPLQAAQKTDNGDRPFAGLKTAKVIFDVRVPDQEKLIFNLKLIDETYEGIVADGVKPKMVVSFRGPGVKQLTSGVIDEEAHALIRNLVKKGVRIEVCAVATRIFKVDNATIIPEVKLVANVMLSFIGYQNRGYAIITIN